MKKLKKQFEKQLRSEAAKQLSKLLGKYAQPTVEQIQDRARLRSEKLSFAKQTVKNTSLITLHSSPKRCAFTLAEVLITLGIIGIVAALTMPALIQNHKKAVTSAQLKKFNSVMANWVNLAKIDLNEPGYWDWYNLTAEECANIYFRPYLKNIIIETGDFTLNYDENCTEISNENDEPAEMLRSVKKLGLSQADPNGCSPMFRGNLKFTFNDGSTLYLYTKYIEGSGLLTRGTNKTILFDTNGEKGPNKTGRDRFLFNFSHEAGTQVVCGSNRYICAKSEILSSYNKTKTRSERVEECKRGYLPGYEAEACTVLLELDNWEFKKDYPLKL